MKIYNYDDNGEFLNETQAYPNPMEKGKFLIPAKATTIKPLSNLKANETQVFKNDKWQKIADFRGTKIYNKETQEVETQKELGEIPTDWTTLVPKENQKWSADKWIDDTEKILDKAKNDLRAERDDLLKNLEVKHDNNIYQADRISLGYIKDIIADLSSNETIDFILKNNEVITITENELKKVLGKARTKTTQIKLEYNQKIKDLNEN